MPNLHNANVVWEFAAGPEQGEVFGAGCGLGCVLPEEPLSVFPAVQLGGSRAN